MTDWKARYISAGDVNTELQARVAELEVALADCEPHLRRLSIHDGDTITRPSFTAAVRARKALASDGTLTAAVLEAAGEWATARAKTEDFVGDARVTTLKLCKAIEAWERGDAKSPAKIVHGDLAGTVSLTDISTELDDD